MLECTEEHAVPKTEEIDDVAPESLDGLGENNLNFADTTKGPELVMPEWTKLKTYDRP